MKAVVMAGGEGSRLRPLTVNTPKPLVPIANRPIMEHIIELLKQHGVSEIVTTLHYLADEIQTHFGDGMEFGIPIRHSIEETPLGTAGSVKQAEDFLCDGTFIIISGDALTDCNLTAALKFHKEKQSVATLILSRVPDPSDFGIVITESDGRVQRFLEKPGWGEVFSDTVNTGIYILEPEIFSRMEPRRSYDWSQDIFPQLLAEGAPMFGYVMDEYWCDVGTLEQYREAQDSILSGRVKLSVPGELVEPGVWVGKNTIIDESVQLISPVNIGSNCRIKRNAVVGPGVIGNSCLIEESARIGDSVVWDRCYLGIDTGVSGGILGSRVTLKRESRVEEGAVIGDRCLIDVGSVIRSQVKVWPDKTIERGTTLTMSLVVGNRWRGSLFREMGVAGLSNIEITPEYATRLGLAFGSLMGEGTRVAITRDNSRSSRMIKRSLMASLLSTGCQVIDLHGSPVPIFRHYLKNSRAKAGISVRKSPGNARLTLLEFCGVNGEYLPKNLERKVEAAFFKEDFNRTDSDNLGMIEEADRHTESYIRKFLSLLPEIGFNRRPRIVVDYGFSSVSPIFPSVLAEAEIDVINLNSFNDARSAPRTLEQVQSHLINLAGIVSSLKCDLGVLVTNEGENIHLVDDTGLPVTGNSLFAAMCLLTIRSQPGSRIVMSATTPNRLAQFLENEGGTVIRSKSGLRDLMGVASIEGVDFAGNDDGGFIFPQLHSGFDGMFALIKMVRMLQFLGLKASDLVNELPDFHSTYRKVACPWESKGRVMRQLGEWEEDNWTKEFMEGVRFYSDSEWTLLLPDSYEPVIHVYAESDEQPKVHQLANTFSALIEKLLEERS